MKMFIFEFEIIDVKEIINEYRISLKFRGQCQCIIWYFRGILFQGSYVIWAIRNSRLSLRVHYSLVPDYSFNTILQPWK